MNKPAPLSNDVPAAGAAALIADLATRASAPEVVNIPTAGLGPGLPPTVPVLFDRHNQRAIALMAEIEAARQLPKRRTGTAKVDTLSSFIDLVNRHKDEHSVIFAKAQWPDPALIAVLDYHETTHGPRWGKHRVVYTFPVTDELKTWIELNKKPMEQADFAAFLEEHAAELAAPSDGEVAEFERLFKERFATPAELIDLSRSLEVFVGAKVKRAERLQTGERTVEFVEEHLNGKGEKVDIPGIFMVSVPAFLDGEPVRIPARLRYRVSGGGITWFYQLYRWEYWLRTRVQNDLGIAGDKTELPTFEGAPEMSA
ncbi:DUF2303 family protein [Chelatococcus sp. XZ-Ab1]|uniref:DUF2303 family protein n=1 Tax=Chelatococcus sp. XZ-Ab1 TaxID=3034027 RepID=UPI0023E44618|nr:DUF2303 family protein [Chelatococcus sp. XZ-Ab1]